MEKIDTVVIGAGVVGLAVACELSRSGREVFVLERNTSFGRETSSRNSEVIHAGIYYPGDSLKARTCIEGNALLYEYCARHNIAHKRIGKLIVAIDKNELKELDALYKHGLANGAGELLFLSRAEVKKLEPDIEAEAAIFSPSTGILDTHGFMKSLADKIEAQGSQIAYNSELIGLDKIKEEGFRLTVSDKIEGAFTFLAAAVINCAGLDSAKVAALAGLNREEYKIKYCKGDYFRVHAGKAKLIKHLVYPVPKKERAGLGIHATPDLAGQMRLGPDDEYVDRIYYDVDPAKARVFYESVRAFMPFIELNDIAPDMAGMRPKLQGPGEPFRDFIIREESQNGVGGLINLIGIESPGLTASLAIAKRVRELACSGSPL